ncbi:sensor histidine kinase [Paenibacillus pini]|uniref:histidine kinase n=1 Tax=Paenibacillus pini JCM 16418 TaxID=1236976 RepID=W7YGH6_9BACL|nr:HAMP domain-containing sensor histidine kinase [Paenibacillus pini]GAF06653.1 sensor histidine kinase [Paenibacillus pini JCM 16418]
MHNRSLFNKLQWKMVMMFFLSVGLTFATLMILRPILESIYLSNRTALDPLVIFVLKFNKIVGFSAWQGLVVILLFILYVMLLSWGTTRSLSNIIRGVKRMSDGQMDEKIPVRSNDEIGMLAAQINELAAQLTLSMQEEKLATQTKNELITNVSHDLRTPLTSIIGYLRLIEEDKYKDEVELRYYVNIAYEKARRMNGLVTDLFEYTRLGFGGSELHRKNIDIVELLGQLSAEFTLHLKNQKMFININAPQDKIMISGDGDKLMRAFENLITNGIRYGSEGGELLIEIHRLGGEVEIQIINYGSTIPSSELPHIFDRFYRVEKSRSLNTGGAGLGLAIVKSIVHLHDGSISVISNDNKTAFIVKLPLHA